MHMTASTDIAKLKAYGAQTQQAFVDALAEFREAMQAEKRARTREWIERCLAGEIEDQDA